MSFLLIILALLGCLLLCHEHMLLLFLLYVSELVGFFVCAFRLFVFAPVPVVLVLELVAFLLRSVSVLCCYLGFFFRV